MKDIFDHLRKKTERIVKEGIRIFHGKDKSWDICGQNCASCLSAKARGTVDDVDYEGGFDSIEDVCMIEARNILSEKLKIPIN